MRRLVSVSSMGYPLTSNCGEFAIHKIGILDALQCSQNLDAQFLGVAHALLLGGELVQGHVVFDVVGYERAILRRHGAEVAGGKVRVGGQVGVTATLDDVAHLVAGEVSLEVGLDSGDGLGLFRFDIGDELGKFLFQQFVLGLKARDEAEDLLKNLAQRQAPIHGGGFAQLVEGVVLLGLVEDLAVDVVDHAIPLAGLDRFRDGLVLAHGILEFLEEHAVDFHPFVADGLLLD